jgi:chemotaxis protein CheD
VLLVATALRRLRQQGKAMISEPFHTEAPRSGPTTALRNCVYLLPGELHAAGEPCQITTILGSCVAVCLWDAKLQTGGMNHFLLPAWHEGKNISMRFGDLATPALMEKLLQLGCRQARLTAKIFGGSALFQQEDRYPASLGAKNVEAAQLMMKNFGIPVIAQDTGGAYGRKIIFHTGDGSAWSKRL